jgi:hypothetical protein
VTPGLSWPCSRMAIYDWGGYDYDNPLPDDTAMNLQDEGKGTLARPMEWVAAARVRRAGRPLTFSRSATFLSGLAGRHPHPLNRPDPESLSIADRQRTGRAMDEQVITDRYHVLDSPAGMRRLHRAGASQQVATIVPAGSRHRATGRPVPDRPGRPPPWRPARPPAAQVGQASRQVIQRAGQVGPDRIRVGLGGPYAAVG